LPEIGIGFVGIFFDRRRGTKGGAVWRETQQTQSVPPQPKAMTIALDSSLSGRRRDANRGKFNIEDNIIAIHLILSLLLALAASDSGREIKMITPRRPMVSSIARMEKSQLCFCWRTQRHQRMLHTLVLAGNFIHNEARQSSMNFYQRLKSPKNILAPMVAQSDLPFRLMCEQLYNVDLSYTQMIHAYNFIKPGCETFRTNHLDVYPYPTIKDVLLGKKDGNDLIVTPSQRYAMAGLDHCEIAQARTRILTTIAEHKGVQGVSETTIDSKPTVVQIAAHDPDVAIKAAMAILERSASMGSLNPGDACTIAAIDLNLGKLHGCNLIILLQRPPHH
jgi:hypothetical protein